MDLLLSAASDSCKKPHSLCRTSLPKEGASEGASTRPPFTTDPRPPLNTLPSLGHGSWRGLPSPCSPREPSRSQSPVRPSTLPRRKALPPPGAAGAAALKVSHSPAFSLEPTRPAFGGLCPGRRGQTKPGSPRGLWFGLRSEILLCRHITQGCVCMCPYTHPSCAHDV